MAFLIMYYHSRLIRRVRACVYMNSHDRRGVRKNLYRWSVQRASYTPLDEEMSRLLGVRHCAEIVIKGERKRTNEQQLMP